jgi:hypothetical protein
MLSNEIVSSKLLAEELFTKYCKGIRLPKWGAKKVQLKHHLDLQKLKESIDFSIKKYGRHPWRSSEGESFRYSGFSLTYNPHHQDHPNINASSLGTIKNKPEDFFYNSTSTHSEIKNSYFDSYAFTSRTPAASEGYLGEILNSCQRTIIRSRMMILDGKYFDEDTIEKYKNAQPGDSKFGWHRDEPIYVNLRINIPLTADEAFVFEMEKEQPYSLIPGYAYSWNTDIPHRVWCKQKTNTERHNLIIGVSPWFDYDQMNQEWKPNKYCGVKDPLEMLEEGLVFDWLKVK